MKGLVIATLIVVGMICTALSMASERADRREEARRVRFVPPPADTGVILTAQSNEIKTKSPTPPDAGCARVEALSGSAHQHLLRRSRGSARAWIESVLEDEEAGKLWRCP